MKLRRLIEQIQDLVVRGSREVEVLGLCADSRFVAPGDLFIAKRGLHHDGSQFISDALQAGAVAVLTDLYDPFLNITQLIHPDIPSIEAKLSSRFFQLPSRELKMIGITGTNGKSTTSFLLKHILDREKMEAGLIGTIEWVVGNHRFPGEFTTPYPITNHRLLREMVNAGCKSAVMEVSSHALVQNRVGEINFDIALLTSFSQDHLDYHKTMEAYKEAKMRLFSGLGKDQWAIYNTDEPFVPITQANTMSYGINNRADLMAKSIELSKQGIQFTACFQKERKVCSSPLIGIFNVYNLLAAIAASLQCGISLDRATKHLKTAQGAPGRLERVKNAKGLHIFVDFAHTPDALENVLQTLSSFKQGKLITVFGCGGDRDRDKRSKMGAIASRWSDITMITSDNPRGEEPEEIIQEILKGFASGALFQAIPNRKEAIIRAVNLATPQDIVLIAGKGHEKQQVFAHHIIPFNDVQVAQEATQEEMVLE